MKSQHPFKVMIRGLREKPGARQEIDLSGSVDGLTVSGSFVPGGSTVRFSGVVEAIEAGEGVVVVGTVRASWRGECRRCLIEISGDIDQSVREIFEARAVEGETYPLEGETIDLAPMVREAVVLELPEAPVCSPGCKGLCPRCGANLNELTCTCSTEALDPRWAALDELRRNEPE